MSYHQRTRFVAEYLPKVDAATMHYGLEARSPFLDHKLWEFAASLPANLRLRRGRPKAILREVVRRRIGTRVAFRKKRGFGIPVQRWIAGRWERMVRESLSDSLLEARGLLNARPILRELDRSVARGEAPTHVVCFCSGVVASG